MHAERHDREKTGRRDKEPQRRAARLKPAQIF